MRVQAEALASDLADLLRIRKEIADEKDRLVRDVAASDRGPPANWPADPGAPEKAVRDREGAGSRAAEVAGAGPPGRQSQRFDRQGRGGPRQRQPGRAGGGTAAEPKDSRIDLAALNDPGRLAPAIAFAAARGRLPLPVNGSRIREFGVPDRLGGTEKGLSIATRAGAQVTAPCDCWVVYAGPFRNYGQVLILNAGGGYHVVLAGMDRISVNVGQFVLTGEPVAVMVGAPGTGPQATATLASKFRQTGAIRRVPQGRYSYRSQPVVGGK